MSNQVARKVAVVAAWVGDIPDVVNDVKRNHEAFANRHGYDYLCFGEEEIQPVRNLVKGAGDRHWIKPGVISAALKTHEFVFWTDLDSVFHNIDKSLSDLVAAGKDFVFTGDHNDVFNGGHLFFRNTDFSHNLVDQWSRLQSIPFPAWAEGSQQGASGYVGDQVAMNFLLAGGRADPSDVQENSLRLLNLTNGWEGNPERTRKKFHKTHAPVRKRNLRRTRSLLAPSFRQSVKVVVQHRLNSYPWWGPKGNGNRKGPIVHFVPPYKDLLEPYLASAAGK